MLATGGNIITDTKALYDDGKMSVMAFRIVYDDTGGRWILWRNYTW